MKLKTLTTAMILATVPMTGAFAAALDRILFIPLVFQRLLSLLRVVS